MLGVDQVGFPLKCSCDPLFSPTCSNDFVAFFDQEFLKHPQDIFVIIDDEYFAHSFYRIDGTII